MKRIVILVFIILFSLTSIASANSDWEFRFFGINPADFKDRNADMVILGGIASYLTHELLGHYAYAEIIKGDAAHWDGPMNPVYFDDADDWTKWDRQMFSRAGFMSQAIVGTALVAISTTRHSDFTLGFVGFTAFENSLYAVTGGITGDSVSDVKNLDNGELEAGLNGFINGMYTYISLNKEK